MPDLRKALYVMGVVLLASGAATARTPADFTFRDAEFMPQPLGLEAAERFVAARFPAGLPLAEARRRAARAAMTCRTARAASVSTCRYSIPVHAYGGVIGDNTWTLELSADRSGNLETASLNYDRGGVED